MYLDCLDSFIIAFTFLTVQWSIEGRSIQPKPKCFTVWPLAWLHQKWIVKIKIKTAKKTNG